VEDTRPDPKVLPGRTYGVLYDCNTKAYVACLVPSGGIVLQSVVPVPGWGVMTFLVIIVLVSVDLYCGIAAPLKKRAEFERGYTTQLGPAIRQPYLFLVHPRTKEILSRPGEPRPKRIS
jgi:hypothetical protein